MKLFSRTVLASIIALALSSPAPAGEFECSLSRLDSLYSVTWKPSDCRKPYDPIIIGGRSVREYNAAVQIFNLWLSEVAVYLRCVQRERERDVARPDIIVEGVRKARSDMMREVENQRLILQLMRP